MRLRVLKSKVLVKEKDVEFSYREDTNGDKIIIVFELTGEGVIGQLSAPAIAQAAVDKLREIAEQRSLHLIKAALQDAPYDLYERLKMDQRIIDSFEEEN